MKNKGPDNEKHKEMLKKNREKYGMRISFYPFPRTEFMKYEVMQYDERFKQTTLHCGQNLLYMATQRTFQMRYTIPCQNKP